MALLNTLHSRALCIIIIPIFTLLASCGAGFSPGGEEDVPHIADFIPNVDCNSPTILNRNYLINGSPVLVDGKGGATNFTNVTLEPICYLVQFQINIPDLVQVIIPPNTVMMFDRDYAGLTVLGGSIIARGTPTAPITFTGSGNSKNNWSGIRIYKRDANEIIFDYTIIEYGGTGGGFSTPRNTYSGFSILHHTDNKDQNKGRISFTNNVIRNTSLNSKYAFVAQNYSYIKQFSNNTIYHSAPISPISITFNEVHFIDNNNNFTYAGISNIANKITVSRPVNNPIKNLDTKINDSSYRVDAVVWRDHGIPYLINDHLNITRTKLSIEAGTELQFDETAGITVVNNEAILSAVGTSLRPITFTKNESPTKSISSWRGIEFTNSQSIQNRLDFVNIYFGGGGITRETATINKSNLVVKDGSHVNVSNSKIQSSLFGYGIYLDESSVFNSFSNNSINGNNKGAGLVSAAALHFLETSSDYQNNNNDYIEVLNPNNGIGNSAAVIPGINTPYAFLSSFFVNGNLTIEPGAILLFSEGTKLQITNSLTAEGTPTNPILFSSLSRLSGEPQYWKGLVFQGSQGRLDQVTVEFAGYNNSTFSTGTGIRLNTEFNAISYVNINNSSIERLSIDATYGLYIETGSEIIGNPTSNSIEAGTCKLVDGC